MEFRYISKTEMVYLGSGLTVESAKEKRASGYYQYFSPSISKTEVLFPRWVVRRADCQGGREGRRESESKRGE